MTKKLIAVGCSYTADDYTFPVWPELLSKKLNMELVNFGRSGMGNEYIATKVTEASIHLNDIGLVVCMWSEFTRLDFQFNPDWFSIHERDDITEDMKHILLGPYPSTMSSLRQMFLTRSLLRNYSIPYIFIQGTSPYKNNWRVDKEVSDYTRGKVSYKERKPKPFREICIRTLLENSYIKFLNEKNSMVATADTAVKYRISHMPLSGYIVAMPSSSKELDQEIESGFSKTAIAKDIEDMLNDQLKKYRHFLRV